MTILEKIMPVSLLTGNGASTTKESIKKAASKMPGIFKKIGFFKSSSANPDSKINSDIRSSENHGSDKI